MSEKIQIALIDDHALFRESLKTVLEAEEDFHVCAMVSTGAEAREKLPLEEIDVILLDINLPDMLGQQLIPEFRSARPQVGIVIVTMFERYAMQYRITEHALQRFVSKGEDPPILLDAIRSVYEASKHYVPEKEQTETLPLTQREEEILALYRQGLRPSDIAHKLDIRKNTVSTHLNNIVEKLGFRDKNALR